MAAKLSPAPRQRGDLSGCLARIARFRSAGGAEGRMCSACRDKPAHYEQQKDSGDSLGSYSPRQQVHHRGGVPLLPSGRQQTLAKQSRANLPQAQTLGA